MISVSKSYNTDKSTRDNKNKKLIPLYTAAQRNATHKPHNDDKNASISCASGPKGEGLKTLEMD